MHSEEDEEHENHSPLEELMETYDNDTDGFLSFSEYEVFYLAFFNTVRGVSLPQLAGELTLRTAVFGDVCYGPRWAQP